MRLSMRLPLRRSRRLLVALPAALLLTAVPAAAQPARRATPAVEVSEASVADLQAAMASGRTTAVALVNAYLARIAAYDHAGPALTSLIRVNPRARAEAAALDAERRAGRVRGPLHGIPVIVKDNYDTQDMPTSAGSLALATSQPARDAFIIARLREAGAIILAKSNLHELAAGITSVSSLGGQTRNPYDPTRCPGGSSGGTGAAIAASFAAVGWGSDTCGSIRIPSAYANLVGLRPTMGLASRTGIVPLSHTQDIGGPMARTVADLAVALDVTVALDEADPATHVLRGRTPLRFAGALRPDALRGARIGVFLPYFRDTDGEIADTVRSAIAALRAQGATVLEVAMPEFDTLMANTSAINAETKFDLIRYLAAVPNAPVRSVRDILDRGLEDRQLEARFRIVDTVSAEDTPWHRTILARQGALRARVDALMDSLRLDALAYPAMRQKPVALGEVQGGGTCNLSAQSGLPAISLPAGFGADGLPIGLELLGRAFADTQLVAYAYALERARPVRRAPHTTPPLVAGRTPVARPVTVALAHPGVTARVTVTVDPVRHELRWAAQLTGPRAGAVHALVLRRRGGGQPLTGVISGASATGTVTTRVEVPTNAVRVDSRLLGPGMTMGRGTLPLGGVLRAAWEAEALSVALVGEGGALAERMLPRR
jgi:Asp-tRNA(Asn)/Glu-tRNA(Gln) amidotransferase A subunit family amidase